MSIPNIILERVPDYIEPVNSPLWFETSSTASNSQDFKYVYRVQVKNEPFEFNSFTTLSTLYKVPPRPSDGHGFFSPHQILKSRFQYYLSPFQKGWASGFVGTIGQNPGLFDNYFQYKLDYGFEYNPELTFARTYDYLGKLGLSFSTAPGLIPGDLIIIDKDNKFVNPNYDGTASVIGTQSATQIVTDINFGAATLNESGRIVNLQRITASTSICHTFNGTRQYWELDKDYSQYIIGYTNSNALFLTDWPYQYKKTIYRGATAGEHCYETLSMLCNTMTQSYATINFYDYENNNITGVSVVLPSSNRYRRLELGVGPQNLLDLLGSGFIDFSNVDYYDVTVKLGVATQSVTMTYKLKDFCPKPINGFYNYKKETLVFLNRNGGWDYFTFTKDNQKQISIERTNWQRTLPIDYQYGEIYTKIDRGRTNLANYAQENYTLKSDWITDIESEWLSSLLTSPEVYLIVAGTYSGGNPAIYQDFTGRVMPINITNTNYDVQTTLRNKIYNITVQYQYALPLNLQNQ